MTLAPMRFDEFADEVLGLRDRSLFQRTLGKVVYGDELDAEELEAFRQATGRATYDAQGVGFPEVTVIAGARAGKDSRIAAPIALYEALFGGHEQHLAKGERGVIPVVAQDQKATRVAFGYIRSYALGSPLLRPLIEEEREAELRFTNGLSIVCFACAAKSLRGWSIPAGIMDELAFFRVETGADTDVEIQTAIRRGGIAFPSTRLVKISTPFSKGGILYEDFKNYFGQPNSDVLVWKSSTRQMNPSISEQRLARERRVDAQRFAREYEAEFSEDLESFLPLAWIEGAVRSGRYELAPTPEAAYVAAVDPSGGGADSFTLAIVHLEDEQLVQDVMRGWVAVRGEQMPLKAVVAEIATLCRAYGIQEVTGDRYAGQWVAQEFEAQGISYRPTEHDKSRAYLEAEPYFAQGRVEILDHPQLARELRLLERRPRTGGRTQVDHPKGGHDDYANALCLAIATAATDLGGDLQVYTYDGDTGAHDSFTPSPFNSFLGS